MINFLRRKIIINAKGRNIKRFIKKLNANKIELLKIDYISDGEVNVLIYKDNYEKVLELKSIYEIFDTESYGIGKIKKIMKVCKFLILSFIVGLVLFIILINLVFDIEVVHSDKDLRKLISNELKERGIKRYHFKKSYVEISKIKNEIIKKYPNKIEWIEIEEVGTKYIVRVEERKINKIEENNTPRNLIAKKNGVVKQIINHRGEQVIDLDTYVNKGEPIISGEIYLNEKVMGKVKAEGKVYAEVWYNVKTTYPYTSYKEIKTGKRKKTLVLNFLNKDIEFSLNKYEHKKSKEKVILKNNIIPIYLSLDNQEETKLIDQVLTFDEAVIKAEEYSIKQMESKLNGKEYIIRSKNLKSVLKDSKIELEMFFAVYEDITAYMEIGEEDAKK